MSKLNDALNMSNEFRMKELTDPINYNISMRPVKEANKIAERYRLKDRIIKETESLGGYKFPMDNMKKRTNPSDDYERHLALLRSKDISNKTYDNDDQLTSHLDIDNLAPANENLIKIIENKLSNLKEESIDKLNKLNGENGKNGINSKYNKVLFEDIEEPKVQTNYLIAENERIQALKHVQTQQKPEYMSLEDLQKEKYLNTLRLKQMENEYYGIGGNKNLQKNLYMHMKTDKNRCIIRREGYTEDIPLDDYDKCFIDKYEAYLNKKYNYPNSSDGKVINYEEEWNTTKIKSQNSNGVVNRTDGLPGYIDQDDYRMYYYNILDDEKKKNKFERPLLTHKHKGKENTYKKTYRNEFSDDPKNIEILRRTKIHKLYSDATRANGFAYNFTENNFNNNYNSGDNASSDRLNNTNKTATFPKSKSYKSIYKRKNNNSNITKNEYFKNLSSGFKKEKKSIYTKEKLRSNSINEGNNLININSNKNYNNNEQIGFIKMIYSMLNKDPNGDAIKAAIPEGMKLTESLSKALGFPDLIEFNRRLFIFPTTHPKVMDEKEFIDFLIYKGDIEKQKQAESTINEFKSLNNQEKFNYQIGKKWLKTDEGIKYINKNDNSNQLMFEHKETEKNSYDDNLPGMRTNTLDFLLNESTAIRLKEMKKSLGGISPKEIRKNNLSFCKSTGFMNKSIHKNPNNMNFSLYRSSNNNMKFYNTDVINSSYNNNINTDNIQDNNNSIPNNNINNNGNSIQKSVQFDEIVSYNDQNNKSSINTNMNNNNFTLNNYNENINNNNPQQINNYVNEENNNNNSNNYNDNNYNNNYNDNNNEFLYNKNNSCVNIHNMNGSINQSYLNKNQDSNDYYNKSIGYLNNDNNNNNSANEPNIIYKRNVNTQNNINNYLDNNTANNYSNKMKIVNFSNVQNNNNMNNFNSSVKLNRCQSSKYYKTKSSLNFTIPKPFEFLKIDYHAKKLEKVEEILEERLKLENEVLNHKFHPTKYNKSMFKSGSNLENVIQREKRERKERTEKLEKEIQSNMRPFSFYDEDEKKYKEKIARQYVAPEFPKFRANPIKWKSQINMYEGLMNNDEKIRQQRIKARAQATFNSASLPPRMEMHDKAKKIAEQERKLIEEQERLEQIKKMSNKFRAKEIPDFQRIHENLAFSLEKKKKNKKNKLTKPNPFTFHEPKKKAELCTFLDFENVPNAKNPQYKKEIDVNVVKKKLQKRPDIEPATSKGFSMFVDFKRKEIEMKKKEEERLIDEEFQRQNQHNHLKRRVQSSKDMINNKKKLDEQRKNNVEAFKSKIKQEKKDFIKNKKEMDNRVASRLLMLETVSKKNNQILMGQDFQKEIEQILQEAEENEKKENENNNNNIQEDSSYQHIKELEAA